MTKIQRMQFVTEEHDAEVFTVDYGRFNAKGWPLLVPLGEDIPGAYNRGRRIDHARVCELYGAGLRQSQIAERVGCYQSAVRNILIKSGLVR